MTGKPRHELADSPESKASGFYAQPILNSPYEEPSRHWELDADRQPTKNIRQGRRPADFITPVPKPQKARKKVIQAELIVDETEKKPRPSAMGIRNTIRRPLIIFAAMLANGANSPNQTGKSRR